MDIRIIKYFLMVAEEENITKAAMKLNISQPPLSKMIKQLESEIGLPLFERHANKLQLTEAGYLLKRNGQVIVEYLEKTEKQLEALKMGVSGTVSIAALESAIISFLPDWMRQFMEKYVNVTFDLWSGTTDEIITRMNQGVSDIGMIKSPFDDDEYEKIVLASEPWVVVMKTDDSLAQNDSEYIDLEAIAEHPLIIPARASRYEEIQKWFHKLGKNPNIIMRFSDMTNVVALVDKDIAMGICPISVKYLLEGKNLVYKKIKAPKVESRTMIVWKKNRYYSQATKEFMKFIKEHADQVTFE